MSGRWTEALEDCDYSESFCPEKDSGLFYFWACAEGKNPEPRVFHLDGSVTVKIPGQRDTRFVLRKFTSVVPDGAGWRRCV